MLQPLGSSPTLAPRRKGVMSAMMGSNPAFGPVPTDSSQSASPSVPTLPQNYNYNDLAGYEEKRRNDFGTKASNDILSTRDSLAKSLSDYSSNFFKQQQPQILEDLNSRGLMTSPSAVGSAYADAEKSMALTNEKQLQDFDTAALSQRLQSGQDALDSGLDLRRGGLDANRADAQANAEMNQANSLAKANQRNQLNGALIGAGGSILGATLPSMLKKRAATTAGTALAGGAADASLTGAATGAVVPGAAPVGTGAMGAVGTGVDASGAAVGAPASGGIGSVALPAAGAVAGTAAYEATRKELAKQGMNAKVSKILGAVPGFGAQVAAIGKFSGDAQKALSGGKTANGNSIADTARTIQSQQSALQQLKQLHDSGEIDQQTYEENSLPLLKQQHQLVNSAVGQGSAWATAINPEWQRTQQMGFAKAVNGQWVSDTGKVIWDPQKGWDI